MYLKTKIAALLILAATQCAYAIEVVIVNRSDDGIRFCLYRDHERSEQTFCEWLPKDQFVRLDMATKGNSFDFFKVTPRNERFLLYINKVTCDGSNPSRVFIDGIRFLDDGKQVISISSSSALPALILQKDKSFRLNEYLFTLTGNTLNIEVGEAKKDRAFISGTYKINGSVFMEDASSAAQSSQPK